MASLSHNQGSILEVTKLGQTEIGRQNSSACSVLCAISGEQNMGVFLPCLLLFLANVPKPERHHEQRVNLKFLCKAGFKPIECWRRLRQVFGDETMSQTQVRVWSKRFKAGQEMTKDNPKSGRPRSQRTRGNAQVIQNLVSADNRRSICGLATTSGLSRGTVWTIVKKDLRLRRSARMVPHLLTDEQKDFRRQICETNLALMRQDPAEFLSKVVTTDETWIATFEPETKHQSAAWILPNEGVPQKARRQRGQRKTMMTVFFDFQGVIYVKFMPQGGTIHWEDYCETLARFKESVRRKRPHLWIRKADGNCSFLLHQDNAPCHVAVPTIAKFREWGIELLAHPPYSLDLALCDFALFPKLKEDLRGHRFANLELLKDEAKRLLRSYPDEFYEQVFADMVTRWKKCIAMGGGYFEGTHVAVPPEDLGDSSDSSQEE